MKSVNYGLDATEVLRKAVGADCGHCASQRLAKGNLREGRIGAPVGSLGLSDAKCTFHSVSLGPLNLRKRTYNEPKASD